MRLLVAVPIAVFALAFGGSFAYHSLADVGAPRAKLPRRATDSERIAVSVPGVGTGDSYLWTVSLDGSDPVQLTRPEESEGESADVFTRTQSFGQLVSMFGPIGGVPGVACNPMISPR